MFTKIVGPAGVGERAKLDDNELVLEEVTVTDEKELVDPFNWCLAK